MNSAKEIVAIFAFSLVGVRARLEGLFLAQWPPGSPAWSSYFERITRGPAFAPEQALAPARPVSCAPSSL